MSSILTSLPFSAKKPAESFLYPAFVSTCAAAEALSVGDTLYADAGADQAVKVGRVIPLALVTGFSRPASPSDASRLRLTARLIACRTGSWLVGHFFRFGMKALVLPAASQKWWYLGEVLTNCFCRPGMKLPVQSMCPEYSAASA